MNKKLQVYAMEYDKSKIAEQSGRKFLKNAPDLFRLGVQSKLIVNTVYEIQTSIASEYEIFIFVNHT